MPRSRASKTKDSSANLGFEAKLWLAGGTSYFSLTPFDFHPRLAPHGMAGFVLAGFWFWLKSKAARMFKRLGNRRPVSFRGLRGESCHSLDDDKCFT